jgi:hypothetical protein
MDAESKTVNLRRPFSALIIDLNFKGSPIFQDPVVVSPKTNRRFYEAIALVLALNRAHESNGSKKAVEVSHGTELEPEDLFKGFVSKLGQICDSRPAGLTVTAFTVLQLPDKVQFVFGSNQRRPAELEIVKGYISFMLSSLKNVSTGEDDEQRGVLIARLLREILSFNLLRIKRYRNGLVEALKECVKLCGNGGTAVCEFQPVASYEV